MSGLFGGGGGSSASSSVTNYNTNQLNNAITLQQQLNPNIALGVNNNISNQITNQANITEVLGVSLQYMDYALLVIVFAIMIMLYMVLK